MIRDHAGRWPFKAVVSGAPLWQRCVAVFVGVLLVALSGVERKLGRFAEPLVELSLAALVLGAFLSHPVVARTRAASGRYGWWLSLTWPAVVLFVDLLHVKNQLLYPLVQWSMFTGTAGHLPDPVQIRLFARYASGASTRLYPGAAVSDVVASSLDGELRELWTDPLTRSRRGAEAERAVRGAARLQELAQPELPIREITVERCRMPVVPPYAPSCVKLAVIRGPFR